MTTLRRAALATTACLALAPALPGHAQTGAADPTLTELQKSLTEQVNRLSALQRTLDAERARLTDLRRAVNDRLIAGQRGGADTAAAASSNPPAAPAGEAVAVSAADTADGTYAALGDGSARPPAVAPIFEQPGVLTGKGRFVLEPSLQYGYSSNNRVALLGYSVIPALIVGLIDVREVKRNVVTAALTGRAGLTNRLEVEARIPYIYRSDDTVSREVGAGSAADRVFHASGSKLGDVELAARYQFNEGGAAWPYFIGGLRFKSRTGRDPFEVVTDCVTRCVGNTTGTGLPLDLPTGSGFYSLQPSLTWLLPSDPAVLFGTFSYLHNFKRDVSRTVLNGQREDLGSIAPGGAFGVNVGIGVSLNEKSSVSFGYDHSSVAPTKQNGTRVAGSVRMQLGTLLIGYSHRLDAQRSISLSVGAGLTRDTPDVTLTARLPFSW